jgi:hypothetical protein
VFFCEEAGTVADFVGVQTDLHGYSFLYGHGGPMAGGGCALSVPCSRCGKKVYIIMYLFEMDPDEGNPGEL